MRAGGAGPAAGPHLSTVPRARQGRRRVSRLYRRARLTPPLAGTSLGTLAAFRAQEVEGAGGVRAGPAARAAPRIGEGVAGVPAGARTQHGRLRAAGGGGGPAGSARGRRGVL